MADPNPQQTESMTREVQTLRAQIDEAEALIRFLRDRTVVLNNEVRHRDERLAQRDQAIVTLTQQLADAEPETTD